MPRVNCRLRVVRLLVWCVATASTVAAHAQGDPQPPPLGFYLWEGAQDGSGNGAMDNWDHWSGRFYLESGSPPIKHGLPPEDGDAIRVLDIGIQPSTRYQLHTLNGADLDLPASGMEIELHALINGGAFSLASFRATTAEGPDGALPLTFFATQVAAPTIRAAAFGTALTFEAGATLFASDALDISGGTQFGAPTIPGQFNLIGAEAYGATIQITGSALQVDADLSKLSGLGMTVSGDVDVTLKNGSESALPQYLNMGINGDTLINVDNSKILAQTAYANIGLGDPENPDVGTGTLNVKNSGEVRFDELNVGGFTHGEVHLESQSKLFTRKAVVAPQFERIAKVELKTHSRWETDEVVVGDAGRGEVTVRDSTLKVKNQIVLGDSEHGEGKLSLIGADAHLELQDGVILPTTAAFSIGNHGKGTLELKEGAAFTSSSSVQLGALPNSSGTVVIDGEGGESAWTVNGQLNIGGAGAGRVEIRKGGKLRGFGTGIVVGSEPSGAGTLVIDGENSAIEYLGFLTLAKTGTGALELKNKAHFTADNLTIGDEQNSHGTIDVLSEAVYKATGNFTVGKQGVATVNIGDANVSAPGVQTVETTGAVVLGDDHQGTGAFILNGAGAEWKITGGSAVVGRHGTGIVTQTTGSLIETSRDLTFAEFSDGLATVSLTGGLLKQTGRTLTIGKEGDATVTVAGGGEIAAQSGTKTVVAEMSGSDSTVTVTGNNSKMTIADTLIVGKSSGAVGKIIVENGGVLDIPSGPEGDTSLGTVVGLQQGSEGTIEVRATTSANPLKMHPGSIGFGMGGKGTLTIDGGHTVGTGVNLFLGAQATGDGTLRLTGQTTRLEINRIFIVEGVGNVAVANGARLDIASHITSQHSGVFSVESDGKIFVNGANGVALEGGSRLTLADGGRVAISEGFLRTKGDGDVVVVSGQSSTGSTASTLEAQHFSFGEEANGSSLTVAAGARAEAFNSMTFQNRAEVTVTGAGAEPSRLKARIIDLGLDGSSASLLVDAGAELETTSTFNAGLNLGGAAAAVVRGTGSVARIADRLTVSGILGAANGGVVAARQVKINSSGQVQLLGGMMVIGGDPHALPAFAADTVLVRPGGKLQGRSGLLVGEKSIKGKVKVLAGGEVYIGASPGTFTIEGDFTLDAGARMEMEIGGLLPDQDYDVLNVLGAADIDGIVQLKFTDGFAPSIGQQFSLITGADLSAVNPVIDVRNLAPGWQFSLTQHAGAWTVTSLTEGVFVDEGDFNEDFSVDGADFPLWKSGFGMPTAALHGDGDADGDFDVDGGDFLTWQRQFGNSPGIGAVSEHVPEPAAAVILLIGAAVLGRLGVLRRQSQQRQLFC